MAFFFLSLPATVLGLMLPFAFFILRNRPSCCVPSPIDDTMQAGGQVDLISQLSAPGGKRGPSTCATRAHSSVGGDISITR